MTQPPITKKIAVCGFYGYKNYGDSIMLQAIQSFFHNLGASVIFVSDRQSEEAVHFSNINFDAIDLFVLGGGGIVSPNFWFFKNELYKKYKKPIVFFNVNLTNEADNVFSFLDKNLVKKLIVRDTFSYNYAWETFGYDKVLYAPDITFNDPVPIKNNFDKKPVSVCLNYYIFKNFFSSFRREKIFAEKAVVEICFFLDFLVKNDHSIQLIPCQTDNNINDNIIHGVIKGFVPQAEWILSNERSVVEHRLANSSFIISSRYHTSLFALKAGVPFIDITHHSKNSNFLKDIELEDVSIDYWQLELNALTQLFKKNVNFEQFRKSKEIYGVSCSRSWPEVGQAMNLLLNE